MVCTMTRKIIRFEGVREVSRIKEVANKLKAIKRNTEWIEYYKKHNIPKVRWPKEFMVECNDTLVSIIVGNISITSRGLDKVVVSNENTKKN